MTPTTDPEKPADEPQETVEMSTETGPQAGTEASTGAGTTTDTEESSAGNADAEPRAAEPRAAGTGPRDEPAFGTAPSADAEPPATAEEPSETSTDDPDETPAPEAAPVPCPSCGTTVPAIMFCEECGARLDDSTPTPAHGTTLPDPPADGLPCPQCGGTSYFDGYCNQCGGREPQPRDHLEEAPTAWVAGVCDRGVTHTRNEDSQAMVASAEPGQFAALVVCDGVSSVPRSDEASLAAARAAVAALDPPLDFDAPTRPEPDWPALLVAAAQAGNDAVAQIAGPAELSGHNCPSCTFVAAVVDSGRITAASVGDSRAYWLPDAGTAATLTTDDSWAQEMIAAGMTREHAERAPQAHAITRWLGPDAPPVDPPVTTCEPDGPGWLCVCSDGLWNYCSEADDLSRLVHESAALHDDDPLDTARALVDWVNARGGRDNVTVVLARLVPATR